MNDREEEKRKITHYFIGHSDSGHTRRRKSFAASRYLCMVKISGFQITQFRKKTGPNNGTKVVSKEAIRMQLTEALLWRYAWRNEAGNPTLQLYQQKMEEHEQ
mgnify:CR=1 FL=1